MDSTPGAEVAIKLIGSGELLPEYGRKSYREGKRIVTFVEAKTDEQFGIRVTISKSQRFHGAEGIAIRVKIDDGAVYDDEVLVSKSEIGSKLDGDLVYDLEAFDIAETSDYAIGVAFAEVRAEKNQHQTLMDSRLRTGKLGMIRVELNLVTMERLKAPAFMHRRVMPSTTTSGVSAEQLDSYKISHVVEVHTKTQLKSRVKRSYKRDRIDHEESHIGCFELHYGSRDVLLKHGVRLPLDGSSSGSTKATPRVISPSAKLISEANDRARSHSTGNESVSPDHSPGTNLSNISPEPKMVEHGANQPSLRPLSEILTLGNNLRGNNGSDSVATCMLPNVELPLNDYATMPQRRMVACDECRVNKKRCNGDYPKCVNYRRPRQGVGPASRPTQAQPASIKQLAQLALKRHERTGDFMGPLKGFTETAIPVLNTIGSQSPIDIPDNAQELSVSTEAPDVHSSHRRWTAPVTAQTSATTTSMSTQPRLRLPAFKFDHGNESEDDELQKLRSANMRLKQQLEREALKRRLRDKNRKLKGNLEKIEQPTLSPTDDDVEDVEEGTDEAIESLIKKQFSH